MQNSTGRFEGRRIAIIGVSPGQIGGAMVARLAAEGATIVVGGRSLDKLEAVAEQTPGGRVVAAERVDLADADSVSRFMDASARAMGGLDGVVDNAALYGEAGEDGDACEIELDSFDRLLDVNLRGQLLSCRFAIPHLLRSGGGSVVLTSSLAGLLGEPTRVSYGIAKASSLALARHVAAKWGKRGIRCNAIVPGRIISTPPTPAEQPFHDAFLRAAASPRLGRPSDIAAAAAFLLSDDAEFVNGSHLVVDGGVSAVFAPAPADEDDFNPRFPFSSSALGLA